MKYMTFNSSCAFAGIANMLEDFGVDGIHMQDYEIVLAMQLPYLFEHDSALDAYATGISLQSAVLFNRYLNTLGVNFAETLHERENVPQVLETLTSRAMLPILRKGGGKHAVIYLGSNNGECTFLNNRREDSTEPAELTFTADALIDALHSPCPIGQLERCDVQTADYAPHYKASIAVLEKYRKALFDFCKKQRSFDEIDNAKHRLFRALVLDGLVMMELIGNGDMVALLKEIQKQFFAVLREKTGANLCERLDFGLIERAIDGYIELILDNFTN